MSLGSIAHLQYYFARTGLLDGKGGQLAKKKETGEYDIPRLSLGSSDAEVVESPIEEEAQLLWEAAQEDGNEVMLPPTVSTYSHKPLYVPPPPDQKTLKKDLVDALENALHALEACDADATADGTPTQGFYEIQGLHILDTTTLAIRAARIYYTSHPSPTRLNSIKPDHQIRKDLYAVMEVLKKVAGRTFAGGLREDERLQILIWVSEVGMMIDQEAKMEEAEKNERENWHWMDNSGWEGKDVEREIAFLDFLSDKSNNILEAPTSQEATPVTLEFFKALADGRKLCQMHNAAVQRSKKQFGQIKSWHEDIAKPYRRADNLRYWLKAAEIRFEIKLRLDVMKIVGATDESGVWNSFRDTILLWSRGVREELSKDWNGDEERKLHARAKSLGARSLAMSSPHGSPARKKKTSVTSVAVPVDL
jgi:hypothetical protein